MLIEIEDEIFQEVFKKEDPLDQNIMVLCSLFRSMLLCKHIVFASRKNLNMLVKNSGITSDIREFAQWILKEYVSVYACSSMVNIRAIASLSHDKVTYEEIEQKGKVIYVPFSHFYDVNECKMLTEHESDSLFYQRISRYVYLKKKDRFFYTIKYENDSYHGSNGPTKIAQVSQTHKLVLCFVDTDKAYHDGQRGSTYNGVKDAVTKAQKKIPIELMELPVREKENLFPPTIYYEFTDNNLIKVIAETYPDDVEISDYFDIKGGVKYKLIFSEEPRWHSYYDKLIQTCEREGICNTALTKDDMDKYYLVGIGDKLCDGVSEVLLTDDENAVNRNFTQFSDEKKNMINAARGEIMKRLPQRVEMYWEMIAGKVFDWGCCLSQESYPRIRNWSVLQ